MKIMVLNKKSVHPYYLPFLIVFLLSPVFFQAQAQISPLSDQYLINPFQTNPAIAGSQRYMPLSISTRQQWIGLNRAPSTQSISIHRRIRAKNIRFTPNGFLNKGKNSFGRIGVGGGLFVPGLFQFGAFLQLPPHMLEYFVGDNE